MDQGERALIDGLFQRMRGMSGLEKDQAASDMIDAAVQANPDAAYLLTQSVLVQEQALQQADARIKDLEAQLASSTSSSSGAGRFLGRVPAFGDRGTTATAASPQAAMSSTDRRAPSALPSDGKTANGARPQPGQRGGGFMAQAMSTATGVAGGMLLASGISSLFGGSGANTASASTEPAASAAPASDPASTSPWDSGSATSAADTQSGADAGSGEEDMMQDADWGDDDDWGGLDDLEI